MMAVAVGALGEGLTTFALHAKSPSAAIQRARMAFNRASA
jgi:hypothetical protein